MAENPPPDMSKNQLLNLQVYNPPKAKPDQSQIQPISFFPSFAANPFIPPQFSNMVNPAAMMYGNMFPTVQLNKVYDIKVGGPADMHQTLNMIYEDIVPTKHIKATYVTLSDRLLQSNYIRSVLFPNGDGDEVGFLEGSRNNLLSHIKFLDLNPYNTYRFSDNPYKGLPDGFLIYRSCYPIQRDQRDGVTMCSKNSMAVNVRVYRLTTGAYQINKQDKKNFADYDQWREVAYYEYIREHITKNKTCPNFVSMHGYYTCENSGIDFDRVTKLKNYVSGSSQPVDVKPSNMIQNEWVRKSIKDHEKLTAAMKPYIVGVQPQTTLQPPNIFASNQPNQPTINLDEYKGAVLTVMTESPTYNLYNWASKIYQLEGNIKKMINSGFHTETVWTSLLFQLIVALYVMQIHKIYIDNFSIRNNVFIKDIANESNVTSYWKYKINAMEFYIPNHGYLLQVDTNYSDMMDPQPATFINANKTNHKLNGKFYNDGVTDATINDKIFETFKNCMDTNNFKGEFINEGGVAPPPSVLDLMNKIKSAAEDDGHSTKICDYLTTFMTQFLNNRIGTYLKEQEYVHVRKDDIKSAKPGQVVVLDEGSGNNRFVLLVKVENGTATILTRDDNNAIIEKQVPITSLFNYSRHEPIQQNYKLNEANLTEEAILETYTILDSVV